MVSSQFNSMKVGCGEYGGCYTMSYFNSFNFAIVLYDFKPAQFVQYPLTHFIKMGPYCCIINFYSSSKFPFRNICKNTFRASCYEGFGLVKNHQKFVKPTLHFSIVQGILSLNVSFIVQYLLQYCSVYLYKKITRMNSYRCKKIKKRITLEGMCLWRWATMHRVFHI